MFHYGVVDRNRFDCGKLSIKHRFPLTCVPGLHDCFQVAKHRWLSLPECLENGAGTPHKNSAIPIVFARVEVFLGSCQVGFFFELLHGVGWRGMRSVKWFDTRDGLMRRRKRLTTLDVSENLGGIRWLDAECDDS